MHIEGSVIFGSCFYYVPIVAYVVLPMMIVSGREPSGVAGFYRMYA
mgnify:CR=1 FL=1